MIKARISIIFSVLLLLASTLSAATLKIDRGEVRFVAVGKPGFLKINGKGGTLQGALNKTDGSITGELKVPMTDFATGIDLRDEHMKKNYFEVGKYPFAVLKITRFVIDPKQKTQNKPFSGILFLHGQEKDIEGTADVALDQSTYSIDATFHLLLPDYKIDVPSYAGVKVADKVDVFARFEAKEQP